MFSIHRMLFMALKKVQKVRMTLCQIPTAQKEPPRQIVFFQRCYLPLPLTLFPKSWYNRWEQEREWYGIFRILRDVLENFYIRFYMVLLFFSLSITILFSCKVFDAVSSNTEKILPINPSVLINLSLYTLTFIERTG